MSYVTLPTPVFLLVLVAVGVAAALLTAAAAGFALRVREQRLHGEYHRHGGPDRHSPADAPFVAGAVHDLHRRAADLAAREAVRPGRPGRPAEDR